MTDNLRQLLIQLIRETTPSQVTVCEVVSVDEAALTAEVKEIESEMTIYSVRLNSGKTDKKIVEIPKVGSAVLVGLINNNRQSRFILKCSDIDKLYVDANVSVIFNGGENGGLCITPTLVQELNKTNQLLTAIIGVINGAPLTQPGGSPSVLQNALKTAISGKTLGNYSQIENDKVKH